MKFDHFKMLVDVMFQPDGAGGVRQKYEAVDVKQLNPLVLAYVGDAYFHLFVRTRLLSYEQGKVQALHSFSAQIVSAAMLPAVPAWRSTMPVRDLRPCWAAFTLQSSMSACMK